MKEVYFRTPHLQEMQKVAANDFVDPTKRRRISNFDQKMLEQY